MKAYVAGDYPSVIKFAKKRLNSNPKDSFSLWVISDSYRLEKNYDQAIWFGEKAVASNAQDFDTIQLLVSLYYDRGDYCSTYEHVCRGIVEIGKFNSTIGKTIDESIYSSFVKNIPEYPFKGEIIDIRTKTKEWLEWAIQFKVWYEKSCL